MGDHLMYAPIPEAEPPFDWAHVERDMVVIMEAQREECTGVGGYCLLTSLTQDTITQRVLKRWPLSEKNYEDLAKVNAEELAKVSAEELDKIFALAAQT
jgi:hypothetical protein